MSLRKCPVVAALLSNFVRSATERTIGTAQFSQWAHTTQLTRTVKPSVHLIMGAINVGTLLGVTSTVPNGLASMDDIDCCRRSRGASNQKSSCGRSGGNLNSSNLGYRPSGTSNGYSNNYGYGARSTPQNYGHNSQGVGRLAGFGNGNYLKNRAYDPRLGGNSFGSQNAGRTGGLVYDSVHNDYHTVSGGVPQQYSGNFSGSARNQYQNKSPWFHGNSGW